MYYKQWSKKFEFDEIQQLNNQIMDKYGLEMMQSLYDKQRKISETKIY